MQRNARERTVVGAKCQGNAGECMGMPGKHMGVSKLPGECRECWGMPGESMGMGV